MPGAPCSGAGEDADGRAGSQSFSEMLGTGINRPVCHWYSVSASGGIPSIKSFNYLTSARLDFADFRHLEPIRVYLNRMKFANFLIPFAGFLTGFIPVAF